MMEYVPNSDEKIAETVYLVEATSEEQHSLWLMYSRGGAKIRGSNYPSGVKKLRWNQTNPGWVQQIGWLDNRPICVTIFWARIEGYLVGFWSSDSELVDYKMIKLWLEKTFPNVPTTNSTNFHHVTCHISERKINDKS